MTFLTKVKVRLALDVLMIVAGISMIVIMSMRGKVIGFAFIGASVGAIRKDYKMLVNKEFRDEREVLEGDERNQLVSMKAGYYAFAASIIIEFIFSLALLYVGDDYFQQIWNWMLIQGFIWVILLFWLNKRS